MSKGAKVFGLSDLTAREMFEFGLRMDKVFRPSTIPLKKLVGIATDSAGFFEKEWDDFLRSDRVARRLTDNEQVNKLLASAKRRAKSQGQASRFGRMDANFWLLHAVGVALARFNAFTQSGTKPNTITTADWDSAIAAAQTLRDLERKGLRVSGALRGGPYGVSFVPLNWLDQMIERLTAGKQSAKKPHADAYSADRAVARDFTFSLLRHFDEAPLGMVQTFADLIGYSREAVKERLPEWRDEYLTDSLI